MTQHDDMPLPREQEVLAALLREIRVEKSLRQADLAALLCQPQSFVSKYESGDRRLDLLEARRICNALGVSLLEFVTRLEAALDRRCNTHEAE